MHEEILSEFLSPTLSLSLCNMNKQPFPCANDKFTGPQRMNTYIRKFQDL